ncbi:hypothetical protein D3C87_1623950 [compost metagenome]
MAVKCRRAGEDDAADTGRLRGGDDEMGAHHIDALELRVGDRVDVRRMQRGCMNDGIGPLHGAFQEHAVDEIA